MLIIILGTVARSFGIDATRHVDVNGMPKDLTREQLTADLHRSTDVFQFIQSTSR